MATIGIFDSGEGGLSVLREITRLLPDERYVYYSDNAHCPYGEKSPEYIQDRAREITGRLLAEGADIIVVACNTATAAAISVLRAEFSGADSSAAALSSAVPDEVRNRVLALTSGRHDHIRFIGMEPAVKPAALGTHTGVIGVLATAGTLKGSKYLKTKGSVDDNVRVVEHVGSGFVELVESGVLAGPEAESVVRASLRPLLDAGADTIVLGCTHYPFLLPVLQKVAGPGIRFIDPAPAVARQLVHVMSEESLLPATAALSLHQSTASSAGPFVASPGVASASPETSHCASPALSHGNSSVVSHDMASVISHSSDGQPSKSRSSNLDGQPSKFSSSHPDVLLLSSGDPSPLHSLFQMIYGSCPMSPLVGTVPRGDL